MPTGSARKHAELAHGVRIVDDAEDVWGWNSPAGKFRVERRTQLIIDRFPKDTDAPILEIGCGSGVFTSRFAAHESNLIATDISNTLLQRAQRQFQHSRYCAADAENLPFPDAQFSAVVGSSILHHLDIQEVIPELWRVLQPNGVIIFAEPNMLNPQIMLQKNIPILKAYLGDSPNETAFVRWILSRQLRQYGFVDVFVEPYDFLHPAVSKSLIAVVDTLGRFIEKLPMLREFAGSVIVYARKPGL